tara:strand:+ start:223 stop:498 length:276 start_codon:yes stop_codon:yes gene_type:complete
MATRKKKFYYKIVSTTKRKMGGRIQKADVFGIRYSDLKYIGQISWNTAGYTGAESEVYKYLRRKKLVAVGVYKKEGGYYSFRNPSVSIKEI